MQPKCFVLRIVAGLFIAALLAGMPLSSRAESAPGEARLARVFQDNMVLQREKPVPIWGWAKPAATVEVSFAGQKKTATADEHGYWKASLEPMKANREGQVLTAQSGSTTLTCKNVLVGEVWLSTGHSNTISPGPNMDMGVYPVYNSPGAKGGLPEIRFLMIAGGASSTPYDDLDPMTQNDSHWKTMSENPKSGVMSEVEYFARVVRDQLDVPVGILLPVSVGVGQSTWVARETLEAFPAMTGSGNLYQEYFSYMEAHLATIKAPYPSFAAFEKAEAEWRVTNRGLWPGRTMGVVTLFAFPSVSYNAKIHPLAPYAMRGFRMNADATGEPGAVERNVAMVKQYRKLFDQQDLYFINCTRMRYSTSQPPLAPVCMIDGQNNAIRETPKFFGGDKRQDFVELKDLGDWLSHYYAKAEAGRRLGLCALTLAYGQKQTAAGACPRMAEAKIEGNKATVRFDLVGDGLVYQPSIDGISGIYLRSNKGLTRWAQVKVLGKDTLEVSHPDIADLETVAYAQCSNPHETLFNSAGLPASGFAVNPAKGVFDKTLPYQILSIDKSDLAKSETVKEAMLSLAHVRRHGYVFQIVGKEKVDFALQPIKEKDGHMESSTATIPVTAYIPAEWKGFEVVAGDKDIIWWENGNIFSKGQVKAGWKPLKTVETTKNGARFVTFDSPVDQTWVIVAEKGHAEEFRKIHRF